MVLPLFTYAGEFRLLSVSLWQRSTTYYIMLQSNRGHVCKTAPLSILPPLKPKGF